MLAKEIENAVVGWFEGHEFLVCLHVKTKIEGMSMFMVRDTMNPDWHGRVAFVVFCDKGGFIKKQPRSVVHTLQELGFSATWCDCAKEAKAFLKRALWLDV